MNTRAPTDSGASKFRIVSLLLVSVACIVFFAAQQTNNGQSLTIQARTLGLEIGFSPKRQTWRLPGATMCRHRAPLVELSGSDLDQPYRQCAPDVAFPDVTIPASFLSIGQGARLRADMMEDGGLRLRLLDADAPILLEGGHSWQPKDEIILTAKEWREAGTLRFDGDIVIGHQIEDGTRNYLLEGRYVVRERLMLHRILEAWRSPAPVTVAEDELFLGDSIQIARANKTDAGDDETGMARGFLAAAADQDGPGFQVVASSTPDKSQATLVRFQNRATKIEPRWLDRVQNDPMLIAITIIATLAGSLTVFGRNRK